MLEIQKYIKESNCRGQLCKPLLYGSSGITPSPNSRSHFTSWRSSCDYYVLCQTELVRRVLEYQRGGRQAEDSETVKNSSKIIPYIAVSMYNRRSNHAANRAWRHVHIVSERENKRWRRTGAKKKIKKKIKIKRHHQTPCSIRVPRIAQQHMGKE